MYGSSHLPTCSIISEHRTLALPLHKSIRKRKCCRYLSFPFSFPSSFPNYFLFSLVPICVVALRFPEFPFSSLVTGYLYLFSVPLMEMRDMSYHHRYKPRDFHFAH